MILVTNNKKMNEIRSLLAEKNIDVKFVELDYIGVLNHCRDLVHKGYEVLTHPLYGSVKPNETIFRSVVLREGSEIDFNSLALIEEAIGVSEKFKKNKETPNWVDSVRDDFAVIDLDIMKNTIERI